MPKIINDPTNKILQASTEILKKVGEKEFSMRMVAKKAKISVGTIYNYYPNKEELLKAVAKKEGEVVIKDLSSFKRKEKDVSACLSEIIALARRGEELCQEDEVLGEAVLKALNAVFKGGEKDPEIILIASDLILMGAKKNRKEEVLLSVLKKAL